MFLIFIAVLVFASSFTESFAVVELLQVVFVISFFKSVILSQLILFIVVYSEFSIILAPYSVKFQFSNTFSFEFAILDPASINHLLKSSNNFLVSVVHHNVLAFLTTISCVSLNSVCEIQPVRLFLIVFKSVSETV